MSCLDYIEYDLEHDDNAIICEFCAKRFVTKHGLKHHLDQEIKCNDPLKCNKCSRTFKRKYHYTKHKCAPSPDSKTTKSNKNLKGRSPPRMVDNIFDYPKPLHVNADGFYESDEEHSTSPQPQIKPTPKSIQESIWEDITEFEEFASRGIDTGDIPR